MPHQMRMANRNPSLQPAMRQRPQPGHPDGGNDFLFFPFCHLNPLSPHWLRFISGGVSALSDSRHPPPRRMSKWWGFPHPESDGKVPIPGNLTHIEGYKRRTTCPLPSEPLPHSV